MDRRTALERLDAVRPESDDLRQPELAGVEALIDSDPAVAAGWADRQEWDRRLGEAFDDVPAPSGLKERLLAATDRADHSSTVRAAVTDAPALHQTRRLSRRDWIGATAGVAAGLAAIVYVALPDGPTVAVADARNAAAAVLTGSAEVPAFDGGFDPRLPPTWEARLLLSDRPFGVLPAASGRHRGAAFGFVTRGPRPMRGVLVVLPADVVLSPPEARSPHAADYAGVVNGVPSITWTSDGFVYVCCVDGNMNDLLRRLEGVTV